MYKIFRVAMLDSAHMSSTGGSRSLSCRDSSLTQYLPLFHLTIYVCDYAAHFSTDCFSMLPSAVAALLVPFKQRRRNTTTVAWQKLWKHCERRRAYNLRAAYRGVDSPSTQYLEED